MASWGGRAVSRALLVALGLTLGQVAWVMAWSPGASLGERYLRMAQWDALHYLEIAEHGYHMPTGEPNAMDVHEMRANVAFFPALPLAARGLSSICGLPARAALLLVSQLFAAVFWFFLILLLEAGGVGPRARAWALAAVAAQPAAFFLVTGYSESMFLAGLLGMLYLARAWRRQGSPARALGAGAFGALMTATRIVGAPLVAAPLVGAWRERRRWPGAIAIGALGAAGVAAFFGWSQARYGHWDLYIRLQQLGWGNQPDYLSPLNPLSYLPRFFFEDTVTSFSRLAVALTAALFVVALRADGLRRALEERADLYYAALISFYIPLSGKARYDMDSMSRYAFPPVVLLLVALALVRARGAAPGERWPAWLDLGARRTRLAWGAILLFGLAVQGWMALLYCRGHWVA